MFAAPLIGALCVYKIGGIVEFWLAVVFFLFCLTLEGITSWIFIRGSKKNYRELWLHAGKPTLLGNGDLISAWPLTKYLMDKRYEQINDALSIEFAEKVRVPFIVGYFSAGFSIIVVFIVLYFFGAPE